MSILAADWSAPGPGTPVVVGWAAYNGLASTAHQSWAFWRAELSGFVESPFVCANGERATMCLARCLPPDVTGLERLSVLLQRALDQLPEEALPASARVGLALAVPERLAAPGNGRSEGLVRLEARVTASMRARWPEAMVRLLPRGHAGTGEALLEGVAALGSKALDVLLVGGVESAHDADAVDALEQAGWLFDGENVAGIIPGEGAALLVVTRADLARDARLPVQGVVEGAARGSEASVADPEAPPTAEALSGAMRALTRSLKTRRLQLDWMFGDLTSEPWRAHEWGLATSRALAPGGLDTAGRDFHAIAADAIRVDQLPECFGDLGAATMATAAVLALETFQREPWGPARCLVTGSSHAGHRGAALLARTARPGAPAGARRT